MTEMQWMSVLILNKEIKSGLVDKQNLKSFLFVKSDKAIQTNHEGGHI